MTLIYPPPPEKQIIEYPYRAAFKEILPKGGVGAELGVMHGYHAEQLWQGAKPSKLYLVDKWTDGVVDEGVAREWATYKEIVMGRFKNVPEIEIIQSTFGPWLETIPDDHLDWLYLDGWHYYEAVSVDIAASMYKVKVGGYYCGHDLVAEPNDFRTGVLRAVFELVQCGYGEIVALTNEHYCDWIMRRLR